MTTGVCATERHQRPLRGRPEVDPSWGRPTPGDLRGVYTRLFLHICWCSLFPPMTVLPSNSFAHVAFETVSRPPLPTHQCLGRRGGGGMGGHGRGSHAAHGRKPAPYRWSPSCPSLQSEAEPWGCRCASSGSAAACSRCRKSGCSYWEQKGVC